MGLPHLIATGLIAASTSGCVFLDILLGQGSFDPDATFPPFPVESAPAPVYTTGRATLALTGPDIDAATQPVVLDELASATTEEGLGTRVVWENEDGWYMSFTGLAEFGSTFSGYLSIDRITGNEHWVNVDPSRCLTTTTQLDAKGVVGTATCRGLRWADYFSAYGFSGFPNPIPDQQAFDAEITFEAH